MQSTRKLWLSLSVVTTVATAAIAADEQSQLHPQRLAVAPAQPSAEGGEAEQPSEAFSVALNELFSGEGGQTTLGAFSDVPSVTFKAMTAQELKLALTGNTLRRDRAFAWHFQPDGKLEGWQGDVAPGKVVDVSHCKSADPNYRMSAPGICRHVMYRGISAGSWSIRGDQLCTKHVRVAGEECISLFLILDRVVGTRPGSKPGTLGKPNDLVSGKYLEYLHK